MKTVFDPIKHVIDSNGTKLFTFPSETCLDLILDDLWSNIMRYIPKLFAIGNDRFDYPGYNVIPTNVLNNNNFVTQFIAYYNQNGGIYTLDNIKNKWLCGEKKVYIMYGKYYLYNNDVIEKGRVMKLKKYDEYDEYGNDNVNNFISGNISGKYISSPSQRRNIIRLYVLSDYVF